nr:serine hydrolase [uncultured Chryseobacterium sp.]
MKPTIFVSLFLSFSFLGYAQTAEQSKAIDNYVKKVIKINEIPGMAVGVVKNNKIIFERYYGTETLESNKKVNPNSMFRVYSTTKLMSNIGLFQLIEQGKISLEDKISKYIDHVPAEWQNIQVKNLVSHSSGLPDWIHFSDIAINTTNTEVIDRLSKEKMEFETGSDYRYNQTNYMLITMIIEKITGEAFEDNIKKNQFSDSGNQVVFSSNSIEKIPNRIVKYVYNKDSDRYDKSTFVEGRRAHSANGLAIALPAFLRWSSHLSKNDFITPATQDLMWKPFEYKNKDIVFAHGWDIREVNNIRSYGFSGGNVSAYRMYPDTETAIIFMSTGYKSFPVHYYIVNHIAGILDQRLINPYSLAEEATASEAVICPNRIKETYGYKIENDNVIFFYQYPENLNVNLINSISAVGSFNDWNIENKSYQLTPAKNNIFELVMPKSQFEKGKTYRFKFVMNKKEWLTVPHYAINVDGTADNNLTLKID